MIRAIFHVKQLLGKRVFLHQVLVRFRPASDGMGTGVGRGGQAEIGQPGVGWHLHSVQIHDRLLIHKTNAIWLTIFASAGVENDSALARTEPRAFENATGNLVFVWQSYLRRPLGIIGGQELGVGFFHELIRGQTTDA